MKKVFVSNQIVEAKDIKSEDGGMAKIHEGSDCEGFICDDESFFVRMQSWNDDGKHPLMESLVGKHVRITIEVED